MSKIYIKGEMNDSWVPVLQWKISDNVSAHIYMSTYAHSANTY